MRRYDHKAEVNELLANDEMVDDVVPNNVEQNGDSTARQVAKNLLRNDFAQRFYVEQVYRSCYEFGYSHRLSCVGPHIFETLGLSLVSSNLVVARLT